MSRERTTARAKRGTSRYDLVVVGAGPAGTAAAIEAAQSGLSVALLERSAFPRDRPGETLHPGVEPIFERLGVAGRVLDAGFLRHDGIEIRCGESVEMQAYGRDASGPWRGFQAPGKVLDSLLLSRAKESGAEILQPIGAGAPLICSDRTVVGVQTSAGDLEAAWVIDASGGAGWARRHLGLGQMRQSGRLIARYGYGRRPGWKSQIPTFTANCSGWLWTAALGEDLHHWCRLALPAERTGKLLRDSPASSPVMRGDDWKDLSAEHGRDVTWRILERLAGPGYLVAGDAGAVLDPSSSKGVLKALMTGIMASRCVASIMLRDAPEATILNGFDRWRRDWHDTEAEEMRTAYSKLGLAVPSPTLSRAQTANL